MHLPHLASFRKQPIIFLTTCIAQRRQLLANPDSHLALAEIWKSSAAIDGWFVGFCLLMPDHVHLFAQPASDAKPLATWVKSWKSISARRISVAAKIDPPIWQAEYFDHFIRSAHSYREKLAYVEQNPVRKRLVLRPEEWAHRGVLHALRIPTV